MVGLTCTLYITIGLQVNLTLRQYSKGYHTPTRGTSTYAQPHGHPSQHISISLHLIRESSRHTLTSAQPLGSHPPVLSHREILLNRSLSH
jgi:hypothetical protein